MTKKSNAQIRRMEKRAASRGQVYVPPPVALPTTDDGESTLDCNRNRKKQKKSQNADDNKPRETIGSATNETLLHDIRSKLTKELKQIDEIKDLNSKDRRSAKRKAEAVAAEDAGMSRVDFLQWCETTKNVVQSAEQKDDETHHRKFAVEKLRAELEFIEHGTDRNAKDRRSAKRKAQAIATEETGMDAQNLLEWYHHTSAKRKKQ